MSVQAVLVAVRERLSEPKRWLKGRAIGYRDGREVCWCLSEAITRAVDSYVMAAPAVTAPRLTWTELRSDVERELLTTLEMRGITGFTACYQVNDAEETTHEDLLGWIDETLARLGEAA